MQRTKLGAMKKKRGSEARRQPGIAGICRAIEQLEPSAHFLSFAFILDSFAARVLAVHC